MPDTQHSLNLSPRDAENPAAIEAALRKKLNKPPNEKIYFQLLKSSIDARQKPPVIRLELTIHDSPPAPDNESFFLPELPSTAPSVVIVGCGPAGMFAAIELIRRGIRPIILDRGKDASARRHDLAPILRRGEVPADSNYCYGEGGAGTFSDGKLYTRATKRGAVDDILNTFIAHGAPPRIRIDAHPHIGSNLLPKVIMALRRSIISAGGEVHFGERVTNFIIAEKKDQRQIVGVRTATGGEFFGAAVILATGHSARDIVQILRDNDILLEGKGFAMGFRIEHPQELIDRQRYHLSDGQTRHDLALPPARYSLATQIDGRGVFSFCMCPGGFIVPSVTSSEELVVNGMSPSRRDSRFANSGFVRAIEPEDWQALGYDKIFGGLELQADLETAAYSLGGGQLRAPAQNVVDFIAGKNSETLPNCSYFPGLNSQRLDQLFPKKISRDLISALNIFDKKMPGYISSEAVCVGLESRTSSPIRVPRGRNNRENPQLKNLYPCGEGAGYAGGIVSAAMDGIATARVISEKILRSD